MICVLATGITTDTLRRTMHKSSKSAGSQLRSNSWFKRHTEEYKHENQIKD